MLAANTVAAMINRGVESASYLAGRDAHVTLLPSNMAAGPCDAAANLGRTEFEASVASPLSFEACSQPDQCACHYNSPRFELSADDLTPEEPVLADALFKASRDRSLSELSRIARLLKRTIVIWRDVGQPGRARGDRRRLGEAVR